MHSSNNQLQIDLVFFNDDDIRVVLNNIKDILKLESSFNFTESMIQHFENGSSLTVKIDKIQKLILVDIQLSSDFDLEYVSNRFKELHVSFPHDLKMIFRGDVAQRENRKKLSKLYFLTVIVAMGSILYELLLAQTLSTTMGNTALRYNITIGVFIAAMGFGALFYNKIFKTDNLFENFIKTELLLTLVGGLSPCLALVFDTFYKNILGTNGLSYSLIYFTNHFFIFLIGFISGIELPLLMKMSNKLVPNRFNYILTFDYLGTLIGAIIFPLVLLPMFSLFKIGFLVSFLNILACLFMLLTFNIKNRALLKVSLVLLVTWIVLIFFNSSFTEMMIHTFYFNGRSL